MIPLLNDVEVRVLGSLVEKEITTPDYYPLSLNALTNACNQTSNRHPVVHFDEDTVAAAADSLREKNLVHMVDRGDTRVKKYRHVLYETMGLTRPEIAVMYVLMVRGPQTVGEIRTRSNRTYDFALLEAVEMTLNGLISRQPPLVARLPRQPGQKEVRYAHLLCGEVTAAEAAPAPAEGTARIQAPDHERLAKLEEEMEEMRKEIEGLRGELERLRKMGS